MDFFSNVVPKFINSAEFWVYHGFVLSGLWVLMSAFSIAIKPRSTLMHVLSFAVIDFTTLFFAGAALYRVYPSFQHFTSWSPLKQGHVLGGTLFLLVIIIQHIGGVTAFVTGKPNPQHRQFGRVVVVIGRVIAGFGWALAGNITNAVIVGAATAVLLLISTLRQDRSIGQTQDKQRSVSPMGKRQ